MKKILMCAAFIAAMATATTVSAQDVKCTKTEQCQKKCTKGECKNAECKKTNCKDCKCGKADSKKACCNTNQKCDKKK